ncbi:MAG: hypothetical protein HRT57_08135 [Crocinitomicaceae bacterium]|nr:hypothetical protein [Crocinitomicaceae bacterium]
MWQEYELDIVRLLTKNEIVQVEKPPIQIGLKCETDYGNLELSSVHYPEVLSSLDPNYGVQITMKHSKAEESKIIDSIDFFITSKEEKDFAHIGAYKGKKYVMLLSVYTFKGYSLERVKYKIQPCSVNPNDYLYPPP